MADPNSTYILLDAVNVNSQHQSTLIKNFKLCSLSLVLLCAAIATLSLLGWILEINYLKSLHPNYEPMKVNTTICFLLCSIFAIYLHQIKSSPLNKGGRKSPMHLLPLMALLIAFATGLEHIFAFDLGLDQFLFKDTDTLTANPCPGRMAPASVLCFILSSVSLLLSFSSSMEWQAQGQKIVLPVTLISLLALIGYLTNIPELYGVSNYGPLALNTSICFYFLSLAIMLLSPETPLMKHLTSQSMVSTTLRKVTPIAVLLPLITGIVLQNLYNSKVITIELYFMLMTFMAMSISLFLIYTQAQLTYKMEQSLLIAKGKLERRNAHLKNLKEDLELSNEEISQFAYVASHDLQEPLRTISGFTDLLKETCKDKLDKEDMEFIMFIEHGVTRMSNLIKDLLQYSRIGTKSLRLTEFPAEEAVQDALADLNQIILDSKAEITYDKLPLIYADRTKITRLFVNLISNAIKFQSSNHPVIKISSNTNEYCSEFTIEDNGIGIESEHLERIFLPFQRLHSQEDYEGTGVGLAICKKIALLHKGDLRAESDPGSGTRFIFTVAKSKRNVKDSISDSEENLIITKPL